MDDSRPHCDARILLICQHAGAYALLIQALSQDYIVTVCARFEGIAGQIENHHFDLLIIEYVSNEEVVMHALELCAPATHRGAHIILLNGRPKKELLAAAFAHGLYDYFPSPVQQELLVERVKSLLR